jgi:hypothetical protein
MKELWTILMEKLKLVEPVEALIWLGITGLFTVGMSTIVMVKFFKMIIELSLAFSGHPAR